jgi:hypothetical protein
MRKIETIRVIRTIAECNAAHHRVSTALQDAIAIGAFLKKWKNKLNHGSWVPWVKDHLEFDTRTAQRYMKLFEERGLLGINDTTMSFLSLTDAHKAVAKTGSRVATTTEKPQTDNDVIFSAVVGDSADLFPNILKLYVADGSRILDCTYGRGTFWRQVDKSKYNPNFTDLAMGTDARNLYFYKDGSRDCVIFDPPFSHDSQTFSGPQYNHKNCAATAKGGHLPVIRFYLQAASEHHRILRSKGIYIIKCQDEISSGTQHWTHMEIILGLRKLGFVSEDLFVLVQMGKPSTSRWQKQYHARKNHSYFLVFRKK